MNSNCQKFSTARRKIFFYPFDTVNCKCKALTIKTKQDVISTQICRFYRLLRATGQNIRYTEINCALGPSKSIAIARFVSKYFTVILPGFQMFLVIKGSSL